MRILASRKRDSVTGEDQVVAVSHVGSSTERYSNSLNSRVSEGAIILAVRDPLNIPGKIGFITPESSDYSSNSVADRNTGGERILKSNAKDRVEKGFDFVAEFLSEYCCVWAADRTDADLYQSDNNNQKGRNFVTENTTQTEGVQEEKVCASESAGAGENCTGNSEPSSSTEEVLLKPKQVPDVEVKRSNKDNFKRSRPGTATTENMRPGIYHEKQVKSLCALHALNNLLQDGKAFKQEDLDKICSELDPNSWVNPHKSVFGLGNYDINVIMTALQQKKLEAIWFDKRKDPSEELNFDNIYGFILNIPSECKLGWLALPIKRKHWVAIRNLPSATERENGRNNFYNLDSKFDLPESIGSTEKLIDYLRGELRSQEKELFLVVIEEIGRLEQWRKNPPPAPAAETNANTLATGTIPNSSTNFLPIPGDNGNVCLDASAGSGTNRRTSNDSGVVDLLPDLRDINVVDLNKEDLMRRQSSGVWSDLT